MDDNIIALNEKFKRIKSMGWVKEIGEGKGKIGHTFEALIGKNADDFPIPDYNGIEIKAMNRNTKTRLHLLNLTPDGDYLFPIKRILEKLGCPDRDNRDFKIFYRSFNGKNYTPIIYGQKGIVKVNWNDEKVDLIVYNSKGERIIINVSWSFDWIRERLRLKLQYLAIVRATSRLINGNGYYHYYQIKFYKLKDFNTFLKLIENGKIEITFKLGVFKSGRRLGQTYDHGTDFSIDINDINLLYDEIKIS